MCESRRPLVPQNLVARLYNNLALALLCAQSGLNEVAACLKKSLGFRCEANKNDPIFVSAAYNLVSLHLRRGDVATAYACWATTRDHLQDSLGSSYEQLVRKSCKEKLASMRSEREAAHGHQQPLYASHVHRGGDAASISATTKAAFANFHSSALSDLEVRLMDEAVVESALNALSPLEE